MRQKEHGTPALLMQCFVPIFVYHVVNNLVAIVALSVLNEMKSEDVMEPATAFVKMAAMALGTLAVYPFFQREKALIEVKKMTARESLLSVAAGVVFSLVLNVLFSVTGFINVIKQYHQVAEIQFALPFWLACIFYGIVSPVAEEIVFRGIAYNALCRHTTQSVGIWGSALLFGAFHGNIVQMIYGSLMGVIMACVYQRYRNLSASVLFHGAANIAVYSMSYFF